MNIVSVQIAELKEYENNPRKISDEVVKAVANSIKEFGFKVPIVVGTDNVIVCGHTRVRAAKQLGLQEVPCVVASDLSPEQIKAFRLTDNKTAELTGWDFEKLDLELEEIDFDMSEFGFDSFDFSFIDDIAQDMGGTSRRDDSNFFSVTFTIENEYRDSIEKFISKNGKGALKDAMLELVMQSA